MADLLKIPENMRSVEQVLGCAEKMDLPNCIVLSELASGDIVFLQSDMTKASANYLLDKLKNILITQ